MTRYLPLLWILVLSLITIKMTDPIDVRPADTEGFSAVNAMNHLNIMASEIHHMGTEENRKVKRYILDQFEQLDIPTEMFIGHAQQSWGKRYTRIGRTENIIATIKGKSSNKAVMVVGHYDSVLGSPGAADDVHSVACILEVAKLLKQEEHDNDIIFLITDGEERGLFGAKAFSEQEDVSHIGVLLNYEARGNSGASISFEWSEGNAWLVKQLKKVATRPVANSMSFEIYKNLPNDTDFTYFKKAGINGINHAFIDGFSYYHNPADTPENISQASVQHTGTNMLALTRHFANTDLSKTKTENATFFNLLGFLIVYPSSWDIFILILAIIFTIYLLFRTFKTDVINIKSFGLSFLMILLTVVISVALSFGLSKLLFALYPQYEVFYAGQFYNHKWYLLTCIGITLVISALCIKGPVLRHNPNSFKAAMLLFLSFLCVASYLYIPTATYFMLYPTIALSIYYFLTVGHSKKEDYFITPYLASLIPLAIWLPTIILFFLAFSLVGLPLPTIHVSIIALSSMVLFRKLWTESALMTYVGGGLILGSLLIGHLTSQPTEREPLPSNVFYNYDVKTGQAKWATEDNRINIGNESYLEGAERSEFAVPYLEPFINKDTDVQPHVSIPEIIIDTTDSNIFRIIAKEEIFNTRLQINGPSNIKSLYINDQEIFVDRDTDERMVIEAFAMRADTMTIRVVKKDNSKKQAIGINSNFHSLPVIDQLPANALRTDGYTGIVQEVEI